MEPKFKVGDEIVVCIPLGEEGNCADYFSGDTGVVVGFVRYGARVLVDFLELDDRPRKKYSVLPSELRHITPLEKVMK